MMMIPTIRGTGINWFRCGCCGGEKIHVETVAFTDVNFWRGPTTKLLINKFHSAFLLTGFIYSFIIDIMFSLFWYHVEAQLVWSKLTGALYIVKKNFVHIYDAS